MSFESQYLLAQTMAQLQPQRLDNSVYFGPVNALAQAEFLRENNIRFFIGVGVPTQKLARACRQIEELSGIATLVVNFDHEFVGKNKSEILLSDDDVSTYHSHYTKILQEMTLRLSTQMPGDILHRKLAEYYTSNIMADKYISRFTTFNDIITICKIWDPRGKVLVFSENGNDEDLVTLLISAVLKGNPALDVMQALRHVKSLRTTVDDLKDERIHWSSGLINYREIVRTKDLLNNASKPSLQCHGMFSKRRNPACMTMNSQNILVNCSNNKRFRSTD